MDAVRRTTVSILLVALGLAPLLAEEPASVPVF